MTMMEEESNSESGAKWIVAVELAPEVDLVVVGMLVSWVAAHVATP